MTITDKPSARFHVAPLQTVPPLAHRLAQELGVGMARLYQLSDSALLARLILRGFQANLQHPDVILLGVYEGDELAGMAMGIVRERVGEVSWLHIFREYEGSEAEATLLTALVRLMRDAYHTPGLIAEYLPFHTSDLESTFVSLGFRRIERLIMTADLPLEQSPNEPGMPLERDHFECAANCLMEAYRGHPSHPLHPEVQDMEEAMAYLERVWSGHYGEVGPESLRVCCDERGNVDALCIGSQMLPGLGFIVQIVTRPEAQGRGLGRRLLTEVCGAFSRGGLQRVALGVTCDNPARQLYEKLGFQSIRTFSSFYWWRDKE